MKITWSMQGKMKITWSMQGKSYQNQTRFKTAAEKFVMDDVRFEDEGVITCRAENVFGVEETKVELTVLGNYSLYIYPLLCNESNQYFSLCQNDRKRRLR